MPALKLTEKESAFMRCAEMILADQCPPSREHYLCMQQEDDTGDCSRCWSNYLWALGCDEIKLRRNQRDIVGVKA